MSLENLVIASTLPGRGESPSAEILKPRNSILDTPKVHLDGLIASPY